MRPHAQFLCLLVLLASYAQAVLGQSASAGQSSSQPPPRLDAYGDPIPGDALLRFSSARLWQTPKIRFLVYGPHGNVLASAGEDRTIRLWDPASGMQKHRLVGHQDVVTGIAFSADGRTLASCSADKTIRLWDVHTGKEIGRFDGKLAESALAFRPDAKAIVVGEGNSVTLRDAGTGAIRWSNSDLVESDKSFSAIAFAPDGKTIAAGQNEAILLVDAVTGKLNRSVSGNAAAGLFFSADGKTLISGDAANGTVQLWDVANGKKTSGWPWPAHDGAHLSLSSDGKQLAGGTLDRKIVIWDSETGDIIRCLEGGIGPIGCQAFSADAKELVATDGSAVRRWDVLKGSSNASEQPLCDPTLAVCPKWQTIATTDGGSEVFVWDLRAGKQIATLAGQNGIAFCIGFTPDGQQLLWGSKDDDKENPLSTINVWSVAQGKQILTWNAAEFIVQTRLSPDGRWLATTGSAIRLWDIRTGKEHKAYAAPAFHGPMDFSPDSKLLAAASQGVLRWWDVECGEELANLQLSTNLKAPDEKLHLFFVGAGYLHVGISSITYKFDIARKDSFDVDDSWGDGFGYVSHAPDGKTLVAMSSPAGTKNSSSVSSPPVGGGVFSTYGNRHRQLSFTDLPGASSRFSPDGHNRISFGNALGLVEMATGKVRHRFEGVRGFTYSAAISADGKRLIAAHGADSVLVWDLMQPFAGEKPFAARLSAKELAACWGDLKSGDAELAYWRIRQMAAAGADSLSFLKKQLLAVVPIDPGVTARLIADLDSPSYIIRTAASKELVASDCVSETMLRETLKNPPSLEVRERIEIVLKKLSETRTPLRLVRALEIVELIGSPEAREYLRALSNGVPQAAVTKEAQAALTRLQQRP